MWKGGKSQCQSKMQRAMFLFGHYISWAKWSRNEFCTCEAEEGEGNTRPTKKLGSPASPLPQSLRVLGFELGISQSPFIKRCLLCLHYITAGYVLCRGSWPTTSYSAQPVVEHSAHSFSNSPSSLRKHFSSQPRELTELCPLVPSRPLPPIHIPPG